MNKPDFCDEGRVNRGIKTIREISKKSGMAAATGVLVAGLMLGGGNARAEEHADVPADAGPKPKTTLGMGLGAGFDAMSAEPRIFASANGTIPLPLRFQVFSSLGVATGTTGARIEESTLEFSHRAGPLTLAAGAYTSIHLWTDKLSPYGNLSLKLPAGFSLSGDYVHLTGSEHPHLVLLKAGKEFLDGKVSFFMKGGWAVPDGWSARAGVSLSLEKDFPTISLDSVVMGTGKITTFSDTVLSANWKW